VVSSGDGVVGCVCIGTGDPLERVPVGALGVDSEEGEGYLAWGVGVEGCVGVEGVDCGLEGGG